MRNRFELSDDCSNLSAAEIAQLQNKLLAEQVAYCRQNSPFYRESLKHLPEREFNTDFLQDIPVTTKNDLALHNEKFFALPMRDIADICFTSGTTGEPCKIVYSASDLDRLAYNDACGFKAAGITPDDKVLLTCTIDRCFIAGLAYYGGVVKLGAAAIRNGLNTVASHAQIIRSVKPDAIVGVPSFIAKLGQYLADEKIDASSVKTIVCIGEPVRTRSMELTPLGRKMDSFWRGAVRSTYASSEIVTSFTECQCCCGGHPPADLAVVEILDEAGNRVPDGEVGEVVVTPLGVTGMPLLRYRTGDTAFLLPEPCRCGRHTKRLSPILGRKAQMLKVHGTTLFPNAFFHVLDQLEMVAEYYMEVSGDALSDEITIFAALKDGAVISAAEISEAMYNHTRIHVPVNVIPLSDAQKRVFGVSRKPVRFFDFRRREI